MTKITDGRVYFPPEHFAEEPTAKIRMKAYSDQFDDQVRVISRNIRRILEEKNYKIKVVERELGLTSLAFYNMLRRELFSLLPHEAAKLADGYLGCSLSELYAGKHIPPVASKCASEFARVYEMLSRKSKNAVNAYAKKLAQEEAADAEIIQNPDYTITERAQEFITEKGYKFETFRNATVVPYVTVFVAPPGERIAYFGRNTALMCFMAYYGISPEYLMRRNYAAQDFYLDGKLVAGGSRPEVEMLLNLSGEAGKKLLGYTLAVAAKENA